MDNHLLVVGKPPGYLSQGDETGDMDLITWSKSYIKNKFSKPGNAFAGLVHRLDRPASGVMVVARTSKAAARLSSQWQERVPQKTYLALISGILEGEGRFSHYLRKKNRHSEIVSNATPGAKQALLSYNSLGHYEGLTLVQINLETGRPHQIRLQFSHEGFPVLGDFRYGSKRPFDGKNLALHALRLEFLHPTLKTRMQFQWTEPLLKWEHFFPQINQKLSHEMGL